MPLPLALLAATMIPGLIPGLGAGIAGIGKGIGSAASGYGKGVGSAFSGLGKGAGSIASGVGGGIGSAAGGLGKGVGGLAEKGLGAVGDFLFGDDEDEKNYDTMTIDNLEIDTLEVDTAKIDKLVIDSKDLGKTDDNKTDNEKLDAKEQKEQQKEQQETQDNLFSGLSEDSDTVPESLSAEGTAALPESLSAEGTAALPESLSAEGTSLPESLSAEGTADSTTNIFNNEETIEPPKANNNKEDKFLPNVETLTESSEGMTNILGGGESSGGSFADLTMDASEMTSELGSISETLATPEEGPGFNWEDIKDAIGGGGGGGGFMSDTMNAMLMPLELIGEGIGALWEGGKDVVSGIGEGIGALWEGGKDVVSGIREGIGALWEGGKDVVSGIGEGIGALWEGGKDVVSGIGEGISGIWEGGKDVVGGLWEGGKDVAGGIWEGVGDLFGFDTASDVEAKAEAEAKGAGNISNETLSSIDTTTQSILANIESAYGMTEPIEEKATWNGDDKNKDSQWEIQGAISYLQPIIDMFSGEVPAHDTKKPRVPKNKGQIHSTDGSTPSRGMTPAYTKAPPARPPSTSSIIIQEIRSYNQYPPWMWKVG